jgi:hypothetical protein
MKFYKRMLPKADRLKMMGSQTEYWSNLISDSRNDIVIDSKRSEFSGLMTMRSTGSIPNSPEDVWRCLNYLPWRNKWDVNCDDIKMLSKQGVGAYYIYNRTKKVFVVAGRDFVMDFFTYRQPDGTILIVVASNSELDDEVPVPKGVIRAESPIGGWLLKPHPS